MTVVPKPQHKRRIPKRAKRGEFSKEVRQQVYERDRGLCQQCGRRGEEIHHVKFKSRGGRGVFTNGLTLCHLCHKKVHMNGELTEYWLDFFTDYYGPDFYKDEWDE
ncbi:hypothetical protein GCM10011409_21320 [Lentibacillus populi]|uniref:HNH nuclease domain-containing protein n=1 Tax=Lentibacillus populi TaxID=1827502 RepID=A0A9W5TY28_9BACI|nr:HNH endonuclease [Lentibacillus populi]GGB43446.1 hypothetical protein GCM10011409_21320 [Lentibacillus populi]